MVTISWASGSKITSGTAVCSGTKPQRGACTVTSPAPARIAAREKAREERRLAIRAWLAERIWQFGRAKDPNDLILGACGEPFDASHFTRYLTDKFTTIYGL